MANHKTLIAALACCCLLAACSGTQTAEGAKGGAASGALGGAVAGAVGSLIFGGNPVSGAASGAAMGAASGAAVGAAHGASRDKADAQRHVAELGQYNYDGFVALANCKYEDALALAAKGQQYQDRYHAVAGLWLEAITYADQRRYGDAEKLFPALEQKDPDLLDRSDTERTLKDGVRRIRNIRVDYGRAPQCGS